MESLKIMEVALRSKYTLVKNRYEAGVVAELIRQRMPDIVGVEGLKHPNSLETMKQLDDYNLLESSNMNHVMLVHKEYPVRLQQEFSLGKKGSCNTAVLDIATFGTQLVVFHASLAATTLKFKKEQLENLGRIMESDRFFNPQILMGNLGGYQDPLLESFMKENGLQNREETFFDRKDYATSDQLLLSSELKMVAMNYCLPYTGKTVPKGPKVLIGICGYQKKFR